MSENVTWQTGSISMDTGGLDEDGVLWDAQFHCGDCGLYYSWPVTPGLAPVKDPKQTEMLALVSKHTPAVCRAAQARNAVELEKVLATEAELIYDEHQDEAVPLGEVNMLIKDVVKNELDGYPVPVSGDPVVTLRQAIERGAVTVTKGLPLHVMFRRSNPHLGRAIPFRIRVGVDPGSPLTTIWPIHQESLLYSPPPIHVTFPDSMAEMRSIQRRLIVAGRMTPAG